MTNSARWQRAELLVFTTVTLLNLLPFVATRFFPSMDGASHLANSNILNQLVFYHNHLFQQFFSVNPEPVPNWTSHLVISLLTLVMPAFLAEKILILALLAGIPFAFRSLVRIISPKNYLYSFLVFPFTHSMFLFFGFFNFCAGVLFLLITLTYWLRNENNRWNTRSIIIFTLLVAATYFSHIVVFGLLIILIILQVVTHSLMQWVCKKQDAGTGFIFLVKRSTIILAASIIPTLLFGYFFYSRPGTRQIAYKTRAELVEYIYTVRPIISFNVSVESRYTIPLFCLLAVMVVTGLAIFIKRLESRTFRYKGTHDEPGNSLLPGSSFWWLLASMLVLLGLYFKLPDAYGTASYTNLRISFIFFLVTILWLSTFRLPWWIGLLAALPGLILNFALVRNYTPGISDLGKLAVSCNKAAAFVEPNSLVLPVYCMDNWFTGHFVDYIAVDKPILMVYNYECESGYFPVQWNKKSKPSYYLGSPATPDRHTTSEAIKQRPSMPVNYVFVVGQIDPAKDWLANLELVLKQDFVLVYAGEGCSLYRNKTRRSPLR